MIKRFLTTIIIFITLLLISGCSPWYGIKNESNTIPNLYEYNTIYAGWIDLGKNKWAKYGYENQQQWIDVIYALNQVSFSYYLRQFFPQKNIISPKSENENIPKNVELLIKFSNSKYHQFGNTNGEIIYMSEGIKAKEDVLETTIQLIDLKRNKELYKTHLTVEAAISLASFAFSLERRIDNASYNIARFIAQKVIK